MIGSRCTLSGLLYVLAAYVTHGEACTQEIIRGAGSGGVGLDCCRLIQRVGDTLRDILSSR